MCIAQTKKGGVCKLASDFSLCHIHEKHDDIRLSYAVKEWIDSIESKLGYYISRKYSILNGNVSGYDQKTGIVYEYHSDDLNGNLQVHAPYDSDGRKNNSRTYGKLFERTLARDKEIVNARYNLVVQWETPFPGYMSLVYEL